MQPLSRLGVSLEDAANVLVHDLKNPLSLVSTNARYLVESSAAGEAREAAIDIEHAAAAMNRMLASFFDVVTDFASLGAVLPHDVPLAVLCARVAAEKAAGLGERLRMAPVLPSLVVRADAALLSRVIGVLLDNAAQYVPAGGQVTLTARSNGEARVAIRITDDGPAIPREHAVLALTAAARLHPESKRMRLGPAFGLPFAAAACAKMGGVLSLDPRDQGACFVIDLPGGG